MENISASQEFARKEQVGKPLQDQQIWANLATFTFEKTVQFQKVKITCTDDEKSEFTIRVEKDFNLRQKVLNGFGIYNKLQEMFLGRYIYNDTLVKVIETQPDKRFEVEYDLDGEKQNLEMAIELQGEKSDARSIINYCRDILTVYQKNVLKFMRFGKQAFFDDRSRESVRNAEHIDVVNGMELTMNIFKPNTMKLNVDYKVASVFNRDVTQTLRDEFQKLSSVTYDQIMAILKNRKFTDTDSKLYLDEVTPKQEVYTPVEVMQLSAVMQRNLRNMRFKRDPLVIKLKNCQFCVENKDLHNNDNVKGAVKRRQLKDFQFQAFCNQTLQTLRNHWLFKENGINFADNYNIIDIERSLSCNVILGGQTMISTHDNNGQYDKRYNDSYKNSSHKILGLAQSALERWIIVQESSPGLKEKISAMVDKMQNQLAKLYGVRIANPNVVEVRDIQSYNWNISGAEEVVVVLNSRTKKDLLTRKYEVVKQQCLRHEKPVPNQVILSKTFEQHDFLKLVVLNLMYDIVLKLPNMFGHKISFEEPMMRWLGGSTMIFAVDYEQRRGYPTVCAILSYLTPDFTIFRSDYIAKNEESDLRYTDESKVAFKDIIKKAILDFEQLNNTSVSRVVVLRDGVSEIQKRSLQTTEVAFFNETFAELGRDGVNLNFLTADKRISTKIFEFNRRENKLNHLEAGIYVDRDIVKDGRPSFQLNASNNRMSKCCFYEVLYPQTLNPTDFDNLMSLVFKLTFMYFHGYNIANIATPGILKYAQKKATHFSILNTLRLDDTEGREMQDTRPGDLKRKRN